MQRKEVIQRLSLNYFNVQKSKRRGKIKKGNQEKADSGVEGEPREYGVLEDTLRKFQGGDHGQLYQMLLTE